MIHTHSPLFWWQFLPLSLSLFPLPVVIYVTLFTRKWKGAEEDEEEEGERGVSPVFVLLYHRTTLFLLLSPHSEHQFSLLTHFEAYPDSACLSFLHFPLSLHPSFPATAALLPLLYSISSFFFITTDSTFSLSVFYPFSSFHTR